MEPPRPPPGNNGPAGPGGSGNKSQPSVFPMPLATRGYPQPALLQQRNGGETAGDNETSDTNDAEATRKAAAKAAEEEEEDPCLICHEKLPDVGRGIIIQCGHVFCFSHILTWSKTETKCPVCRRQFMSITKTLNGRDITRKNACEARFKYKKGKNEMNKEQIRRERRKLASYKTPSLGKKCHRQMQEKYVATKIIRVRPCSQQKSYNRRLRNAPHPQAPGGIFHQESIELGPINEQGGGAS